MKKSASFFLFLLLMAAFSARLLYSQKEMLVSVLLKSQLKRLTGTDIALEGVILRRLPDSRLWSVDIKKMLIKNPDKFEIPNLALLRDIRILADPWRLLHGELRILSVYAYLQKSNFQTSGAEVFNIATLPAIQSLLKVSTAKAAMPALQIDRLEFKFGKLYHLDFSARPPARALYDLKGQTAVYVGVKDPAFLVQAPVGTFLDYLHQNLGLPAKLIKEKMIHYEGLETLEPASASPRSPAEDIL